MIILRNFTLKSNLKHTHTNFNVTPLTHRFGSASSPPPGCSEMLMAKVVSDLANRTPGKEAVAMESFAKALMMVRRITRLLFLNALVVATCLTMPLPPLPPQLPTIIADNAGYDSADLVAQLRAAHQENKTTHGLSEWAFATPTSSRL